MDTIDKVIKAAEKLQLINNSFLSPDRAFTPLAVLWAGYTIAEAIRPSKEELTSEFGELLQRFHEVNDDLDPSMKAS